VSDDEINPPAQPPATVEIDTKETPQATDHIDDTIEIQAARDIELDLEEEPCIELTISY